MDSKRPQRIYKLKFDDLRPAVNKRNQIEENHLQGNREDLHSSRIHRQSSRLGVEPVSDVLGAQGCQDSADTGTSRWPDAYIWRHFAPEEGSIPAHSVSAFRFARTIRTNTTKVLRSQNAICDFGQIKDGNGKCQYLRLHWLIFTVAKLRRDFKTCLRMICT